MGAGSEGASERDDVSDGGWIGHGKAPSKDPSEAPTDQADLRFMPGGKFVDKRDQTTTKTGFSAQIRTQSPGVGSKPLSA